MKPKSNRLRWIFATGGLCTLVFAVALVTTPTQNVQAASLFGRMRGRSCDCNTGGHGCGAGVCPTGEEEVGGTWYWLRSPDEEKRVVISLYNRYCVRCHGVDGRGVWDIPDVPNFTNE